MAPYDANEDLMLHHAACRGIIAHPLLWIHHFIRHRHLPFGLWSLYVAASVSSCVCCSEEVAPPFQTMYFSDEFMIKYQPLAQAKQRLREDANDAEAQKVYDEHFPLYKPHGGELHQ
eukprot:s2326_g6.t1